MKKFIYSLFIISLAISSCKKDVQQPQQQVRIIDYDTRQGIGNVEIKVFEKGGYWGPFAMNGPLRQDVLTSADGKASLEIAQDGNVQFSATGYLGRSLGMSYAKGDVEMIKSAKVEVEFVNAHLMQGTIQSIQVKFSLDPQLSALNGDLPFWTPIDPSKSSQVITFKGAAGKINNVGASIVSQLDSVNVVSKDTTIQVIPGGSGTTRVQFKF